MPPGWMGSLQLTGKRETAATQQGLGQGRRLYATPVISQLAEALSQCLLQHLLHIIRLWRLSTDMQFDSAIIVYADQYVVARLKLVREQQLTERVLYLRLNDPA